MTAPAATIHDDDVLQGDLAWIEKEIADAEREIDILQEQIEDLKIERADLREQLGMDDED